MTDYSMTNKQFDSIIPWDQRIFFEAEAMIMIIQNNSITHSSGVRNGYHFLYNYLSNGSLDNKVSMLR